MSDNIAALDQLVLPSRRRFLKGAVAAAGGLVAVSAAACVSTAGAGWTYQPSTPGLSGAGASPALTTGAAAAAPVATMDMGTPAPAASSAPAAGGATASDNDAAMKAVIDRFLGGEWQKVDGLGNQPLEPTVDGDAKVYDLSVDKIKHRIDAVHDPLDALGFNATWPGPRLHVTEGDRVRATFTNHLDESTGIHFHGQAVPNAMDGVPGITQDPIKPGGAFTYTFTAKPSGSHMYHSHHNATDQVGRGLLGAFIVDPKAAAERYDRKYGVTQDIVWISNDALGGFTINGRGFPATQPLVAKLGEVIVVRFMNEGVMMHPWHLHGIPMHVVARDGWPLGSAAFTCDTLGVNPGERWDVVITCDNPGAWAFHCHILPHAEGPNGMFGMVTALIVT
jgi:FtsP/CotA-like multicopper oxidase with cupredoxin domain